MAAFDTLDAHQFQARLITTSDSVRLRTAIWNAAEGIAFRGVCVLLQGQTEYLEKYEEVIHDLRQRGFCVAAFDWRGQGGSQRGVDNPLIAHIADFAQYDEDLRAFMRLIVRPLLAETGSLLPIVFAHSMGGHILLRYLHDHPDHFKAAILSAPMLRISTRGKPEWLVPRLARWLLRLGQGQKFVWGMEERDPLLLDFSTQLVTSDRMRFARAQDFIAHQPELRVAGPSWQWLSAAYDSIGRVMQPGFAARITTPILLVGAGRDRIVQVSASRSFAARLPHGSYFEIPESEHELAMENDLVRARFWKAVDGFLKKELGPSEACGL